MIYPEKEEGEIALGLDGEANNATDCIRKKENYLRDFWDFRYTRKRNQRFGNSIGKACENKPKLRGSEMV
jgi:hypothetical protein